MTAQELLRALVDLIDKNSKSDQPVNTNNAELTPVEVDHTDQTVTTTMVPPLQVKMELLKKAVGVDSIYDTDEPSDNADELDILKKNAGINPAVVQIASDDEPLDV
jgi:hypothetical protein